LCNCTYLAKNLACIIYLKSNILFHRVYIEHRYKITLFITYVLLVIMYIGLYHNIVYTYSYLFVHSRGISGQYFGLNFFRRSRTYNLGWGAAECCVCMSVEIIQYYAYSVMSFRNNFQPRYGVVWVCVWRVHGFDGICIWWNQ